LQDYQIVIKLTKNIRIAHCFLASGQFEFEFGRFEFEFGKTKRGGTSVRQNRILIYNFLRFRYLQFYREKWRTEVPPVRVIQKFFYYLNEKVRSNLITLYRF